MAQPYQDEPLASDYDLGITWSSESSDDEECLTQGDTQTTSAPTVSVTERSNPICQCGKCEEWPGQKEYEKVCCCSYDVLCCYIEEDPNNKCITSHEGMFVNCLSRYSIEATISLFKSELRHYYNNHIRGSSPHNTYRHVAYSNFVRWIWKTTGKKNRRILPACVVASIRQKFPDPSKQYVGFKYAE